MKNSAKLEKFLHKNFPGLPLEPPLFYNSYIGIRFELGVPYRGIDHPGYFFNLTHRAVTIFDVVFPHYDKLFVVAKRFRAIEPYVCINTGEDVFPKYLKNRKIIQRVDLIDCEKHYEENGDLSGITKQHSLICKKEEIDYKGILIGIAHQDFAKEPHIANQVYFINIPRRIIFHMYDDRGLDLISDDPNALLEIYQKFNTWILDYDRKRMDSLFKD